jgi:hypothetical protein
MREELLATSAQERGKRYRRGVLQEGRGIEGLVRDHAKNESVMLEHVNK